MTALVACETVLLVLLVVLVAGLLRSHAEILRRLGPAGGSPDSGSAAAFPNPDAVRRQPGTPAPDLAGLTPDGDALKLSLAGASPTLLAFLSTGCTTCQHFWQGLGERSLPGGLGLLVVTRDPSRESPSRVRALASADVTVLMSSEAYDSYGVPGSPYFVFVDGSVRGEGVATTWDALESLLTDALADAGEGPSSGTRAARIEARLAAAGIAPGDPSLYPADHGAGAPPPTPPNPSGGASLPSGELARARSAP